MMEKLNYWSVLLLCGMTLGLMACGSDDDEDDGVDTTPISMLAGNEKTISGADTITVANEFVAYAKGNVVNAWHVGETSLLVNGKKTISLKVNPVYHLYNDPICNWGCSLSDVRNHQKQGTLSSKSDNEILVYENAGAASLLGYNFENGKLKSVIAMVSTNHSSSYASYLTERFLMLPYYEGEDTYFMGADNISLEEANTVVVMKIYSTSYLSTVYMPANQIATRSSMATRDFENEAQEIIHKLNWM